MDSLCMHSVLHPLYLLVLTHSLSLSLSPALLLTCSFKLSRSLSHSCLLFLPSACTSSLFFSRLLLPLFDLSSFVSSYTPSLSSLPPSFSLSFSLPLFRTLLSLYPSLLLNRDPSFLFLISSLLLSLTLLPSILFRSLSHCFLFSFLLMLGRNPPPSFSLSQTLTLSPFPPLSFGFFFVFLLGFAQTWLSLIFSFYSHPHSCSLSLGAPGKLSSHSTSRTSLPVALVLSCTPLSQHVLHQTRKERPAVHTGPKRTARNALPRTSQATTEIAATCPPTHKGDAPGLRVSSQIQNTPSRFSIIPPFSVRFWVYSYNPGYC